MALLKVTGLTIVSYIAVSIAVGTLFGADSEMARLTMHLTALLLACAYLTCLLKGIVFGFDRVRAEASVEGVFGIVALLLVTVFIISEFRGCATALLG